MVAPQISTKYINRIPFTLVRELALYAASALSMTAAAIHLWVMPEHFGEWWGYGAFFLVMALVQGLFGVALLRFPTRKLFLAGVAGNLGLVAFYAITRTAGIPFVGPHAGEVHPAGALDVFAVGAEVALVFALVALAGEVRKGVLYAALGAVGALGVGAALHVLHTGMHEASGLNPVLHWLQTSVVAVPLSTLTLWAATFLSRRVSGFFFGGSAGGFHARISWSLTAAALYAAAGVPANGLASAHADMGSFAAQAARDAGVAFGVGFLVLFAVAALRGTPFEAPRAINFWRPRAFAAVAGIAMGLMVVGGPAVLGSNLFSSPVEAQAAPADCSADNANRTYDVAAINVDLPFNRWGDVDPDGQIYVLQQDKSAVKNWSKPLEANPANPNDNRRLRPRPLVIRANVNECVEIKLTNEMNQQQWGGRLTNPRVSMQVRGIAYDAQTSDGGAVGYNEDTTAGIGETKTYYWRMPAEEGLHLFRSQTMTSGEEEDAGSNAHGLYGAIAVEPAGSTWHDPVSGRELYTQTNTQSGELYIDADIRVPGTGNNDFRESVQLAQDYNEVQPGLTGHGFNYGTEPQRNREKATNLPPDGLGEEVSLSSWGYGDPALVKLASGPGPWKPPRDANGKLVTDPAVVEDCNKNNYPGFDSTSCYTSNVNHTYKNDPTKIRYAMAGVAETHVFHLHANQWLANPKDTAAFDQNNPDNAKSATIDSQTFGPGETFTADLLYGAGSKPGTIGDSIFHCHLYPHFAEGFWSLMRVHDVKEDGTKSLPDGTNVRNLEVLPDRVAQAPSAPTADNPGFPRFMPGEFGWRAPQSPGNIMEQKPGATDNPSTIAREDLQPAKRIVAGKALDNGNAPLATLKQELAAAEGEKTGLEGQLAQARTDLVAANAALTQAKADLQTAQDALAAAKSKLAAAQTALAAEQVNRQAVQTELDGAKAQLQAAQDALAAAKAQLATAQTERNAAQAELDAAKAELPTVCADTTTPECAALNNKISDLEAKISGLDSQIASLNTQISGFETQIAALNTQIAGLNARTAELDAKIAALNGQITALNTEISDTEAQIATLNTRISGTEAQIAALNTQIAGLNERTAELDAKIAALNGQITALNTEISDTEAQIATLNTRISDTEAQIAALNTQIADLPGQISGKQERIDTLKKLILERSVMERNAGPNPKPGAPFAEPCAPGSREVTYNVSVMQRDIVYNEDGWHDNQGRFLVLNKDVPKMLEKNPDGSYKHQPEPLFARVNAGDCVNFNLTNLLPNWFGNDAFVKLIQTNMMGQHIHLVKFDVLASDGSTNGWNYQQAAFTEEQANFNKRAMDGTLNPGEKCDATGCRLPDPADWNAAWDGGERGGTRPGQTISERWYADYELRTVFSHDHHFAAVDQNRGQFAGLLVEAGGMNFRNPKTGQFYQPGNGNVPNAKNCGSACEGDAVGSAMDVIGPNPGDDFREFGLAIQDFVSNFKKEADTPAELKDPNNALVPPAAPEHYPDADPGIVGVNYRNAPFLLRQQDSNGNQTDPAHVFSSTVHGDPQTPVMQAYSEDPVQVRLIQGSQEHQHVFSMNGMRWKEDPNNDKSPYVSTQDIGISEAFNFKVPKISCGPTGQSCAGDYLYSSTNVDDLYMGMWGILRARSERVPSLLPLPDNAPATTDTTPEVGESVAPGLPTANKPPESNDPATVCPTGAPVKRFDVVAMETKLKYNKDGDHDPFGLIYALASDEAAIKRYETNPDDPTAKKPEPLVLRANEGDCIEVRLTNKISPSGPFATQHAANGAGGGDAMTPMEPNTGTRAGLRVSLSPQIVKYDVRGSDGTAVGFNRDQTVAPGSTKTYRWHADDVGAGEIGATNLLDFGDVRGHRHHGLFAGLNIEPKNATHHDPKTGEEIKSGVSADIRVPNAPDFREHTLFFQDGLNLRDKAGNIIADSPDPAPHVEPVDPNAPPEPPEQNGPAGQENDHIDQGEKGFNYGSAPFRHRIGREAVTATAANPLDGRLMANVYSSRAINPATGQPNGDPDTPVFRSYAGDDVRMRVLQGADKQRQNVFEQLGHAWRQYPDDPNSPLVSAQGGFNVGRALNVHIKAGNGFAGDYRYADGMYRHHLSAGMWGLSRVYPQPAAGAALNPTPIGPVDDPRTGGHPLMPLEVPTTATTLALDAAPASLQPGGATTLSGRLVTANGPVANQPVVLEQKPAGAADFAAVPGGNLQTNAEGNFSLADVKPDKTTDYRAVFAGAPGRGLTGSTSAVKQVVVQAAPVVKAKTVVSLNAGAARAKLGGKRTISGAVSPAHAGTVKLTIRKPGKDLVKNLPLRSSRFSFTYKPPVAGAYAVQVSFAGDGDHLAGVSPVRRFSVLK